MKVVIGIVSFNNTQEQLERLLKSISASYEIATNTRDLRLTVIGIDNGKACLEMAFQKTSLSKQIFSENVTSRGNIGFGSSMNILMRRAFETAENNDSADLFIAVNPDGLFHRQCLKELVAAASDSTNYLLEARQFPEEHPKPYSKETGATLWATGACLAVPKKIFETVGGFDENLFMYGEDVDISWRARAAGFGVRVVHDAIFVHPTLGRVWSKDAKKHFFLSAVYLAHKWRADEFKQPYEDDYRARFGESDEDLSLLLEVIKKGEKSSGEIVNTSNFTPVFDRSRSFSPARWTY